VLLCATLAGKGGGGASVSGSTGPRAEAKLKWVRSLAEVVARFFFVAAARTVIHRAVVFRNEE
jgi:hypothetical protein